MTRDAYTLRQWLRSRNMVRDCPAHGTSLAAVPRSLAQGTFLCTTGDHCWRYRRDVAPRNAKARWYPISDEGRAMSLWPRAC